MNVVNQKKERSDEMDKNNVKFIFFCNECNWEEETVGVPYYFCEECGHVNISYVKTKDDKK
ncbi:hypothetical protein [Lysinibacillus xylanilyticus]|uniref:hypothetical protein n=1 Tax=Lysinibacillus xylanilyticus TaxID=582475 RepID=UPI003CFC52D7